MKKNNHYSIYLITILLLLTISFHAIHADESTNTLVSIESLTLSSHNAKTTQITITNASDLVIAKLSITWDPSLVELIEVDDSVTMFDSMFSDIDDQQGIINITAYNYGDGEDGTLILASLEFMAKPTAQQGDWCDLTITATSLIDSTLQPQSNEIQDGKITIDQQPIQDETVVFIEDFTIPHLGTNSGYLQILNVTDLAFLSLNLSWDPTLIRLQTVNSSPLHSDFDMVLTTIDQTQGILHIDAYKFGTTGLQGDVDIGYLTFSSTTQSMNGDSSPLTLYDSILWNVYPSPINHTSDDGIAVIVDNITTTVISVDDVTLSASGTNTTLISILNCDDLAIASFEITWDPTLINVTEVNTSESFTDFDSVFYTIDYNLGLLSIDAYRFGEDGLNGDVTVAQLTLSSVVTPPYPEEYTDIVVNNSYLWDAIPFTINHTVNNGIVTITEQEHDNIASIEIDNLNIEKGTIENTVVSVNNVEDLAIASVTINWDPTLLSFVSIDDQTSSFDQIFTNNAASGTLKLTGYNFGEGISGDLEFCTIAFEATDTANHGEMCDITLSQTSLINDTLQAIIHDLTDGVATVYTDSAPLKVDIGGPYKGKIGKTIQLQATVTGGISPYTYQWDLDDDGQFDDASIHNPTKSWDTTGTYDISVMVTDNLGISQTNSTTVKVSKESSSNPPDNNDPGDENPAPQQTNHDPNAVLRVSSTDVIVDTVIEFDASESIDSDGDALSYSWDFGDDSTSTQEIISYQYSTPGEYTVKLTVTDSFGGSDTNTTLITIRPKGNNPPGKPVITGPEEGSKNTLYMFQIVSTDSDNDTLYYQISWGDGSNTNTAFNETGVMINLSHQWQNAGVYEIAVIAIDEQQGSSQKTTRLILIDAIEVESIGYLIDTDEDGIYDAFTNKQRTMTTSSEGSNGVYDIDVDDDEIVDYQYNTTSNVLTSYEAVDEPDSSGNKEATDDSIVILIVVVLVLLIIIVIISNMRGKKPKK